MEKASASPGFGVGGNEVTFPPSLEGSLPPSNPQITQIHKYKICSHRRNIGVGWQDDMINTVELERVVSSEYQARTLIREREDVSVVVVVSKGFKVPFWADCFFWNTGNAYNKFVFRGALKELFF